MQDGHGQVANNGALPLADFLGAIVEDTGIGAYGSLYTNTPDLSIPHQLHVGRYGALTITPEGSWRYLLHEMDSQRLGLNTDHLSTDTLKIHFEGKDRSVRFFKFEIEICGLDDIPDIRGARVLNSMLMSEDGQPSKASTLATEDPVFRMIDNYLNLS